jgi:hypothetical protein
VFSKSSQNINSSLSSIKKYQHLSAPRKAALDQGKIQKKKLKDKSSKTSSVSSSILSSVVSETSSLLSSSPDDLDCQDCADELLHSIKSTTEHNHCVDCQCLLGGFTDESIAVAARFIVDIHDSYYLKSTDEIKEIQYNVWRNTVSYQEIISANGASEIKLCDHIYRTPESFGGGELCRKNWLWCYGISDHSEKQFAKRFKNSVMTNSAMGEFVRTQPSARVFTESTDLNLPYDALKLVYEETFKYAGDFIFRVYIYINIYIYIKWVNLNFIR